MSKPTLSLYSKWNVSGVYQDAALAWQWAIELSEPGNPERTTLIVNQSRDEIMAPIEIVDGKLITVSMSLVDTTLTFQMPNGHIHKIGLKPTQYAISDPVYGGLSYPQWPEELEEAGIPSHPEEDVSAPASEEWAEERERLIRGQEIRIGNEAQEFVLEDQNEA